MMNRRVFLKSGAMALLSLGFAPSFVGRAAAAVKARRKLLVAIFQRGAVDGLNMIVPYGESEYYRLRPTIAIPRPGSDPMGSAIDLDGFFGLHPSMSPLEPLWNNRSLAIVHACGSPDNTRSHFDAQDYMESATPGVKATRDGWLNRYLQETNDRPGEARQGRRGLGEGGNPLRGVALTRTMPRSLEGRAPALAIGSVEEFAVRGAAAAFETEYTDSADATLGAAARDAFAAMRTLHDAAGAPYRPAAGVEYPPTPFGKALAEIARLAKADVGLEVAFTESGNWDHHVDEGAVTGQIANRLGDFSRALAAFTADLGSRLADTVIVTMSEFGRAVAENGNRGTDHGHGNAMLVMGGGVHGGIHGRWPGLGSADRFEGRDLAVTTDVRDVFSEIVTALMGVPREALSRVFPGYMAGRAMEGLIAVAI
jgi:uncharacterized protein (DUF1501 family)